MPQTRHLKSPLPERPCLQCGATFAAYRNATQFCCRACRNKYHNRRTRKHALLGAEIYSVIIRGVRSNELPLAGPLGSASYVLTLLRQCPSFNETQFRKDCGLDKDKKGKASQ